MSEPVKPETTESDNQTAVEDLDAKISKTVNAALTQRFGKEIKNLMAEVQALKAPPPKQEAPEKNWEAELTALRAELDNERKQAKLSAAYGQVKDYLNGKVKAETIPFIADVIKARNLVSLGEQGAQWGEGQTIEAGLKDWLSTKEAEAFKLAPKVNASTPGTKTSLPARTSNKPDPAETEYAIRKMFFKE